MDVVWIVHEPFEEVIRPSVNSFASREADQRVVVLPDYSAVDSEVFAREIAPLVEGAYRCDPVIIVWCLHVGNPQVHSLYRESPARLNVIVDHDLFTVEPEGCVETPNPHELLLFTRLHWMSRHQFPAPNRRFTPTRWYKLDGPLRPDAKAFVSSPAYATYDKWRHAIFADSLLFAPGPFAAGLPFEAVYEKPWLAPMGREGTTPAPVDLRGPAGVRSAQYLAGFWISRKSSILAEAVFHGCIPVIHPQPEVAGEECGRFILSERPNSLCPQLSDLVIDKGNASNGQSFATRAVTTTGDFAGKIRALQADAGLRDSALREVARQWLLTPFGVPVNLPSVADVAFERLQTLS